MHYEGVKIKDINEILKWVEENQDKVKCIGCNMKLSNVPWTLDWYPHDGGIFVESENSKLWIYVRCEHCGYENAMWKLFRQVSR